MRPRYRDLPRWLLIERRDALSQSKECRSREENIDIVAERATTCPPRQPCHVTMGGSGDRAWLTGSGRRSALVTFLDGVRVIMFSRRLYNAAVGPRPTHVDLRSFRRSSGI